MGGGGSMRKEGEQTHLNVVYNCHPKLNTGDRHVGQTHELIFQYFGGGAR